MELASSEYAGNTAYDELLDHNLQPRLAARPLFDYLNSLDEIELAARRKAVDATIMAMGITFTIYSESGNIDRAWPFDPIPRVMARKEWDRIQAGLKQRLTALNLFINDLYNGQRIIKDRVFPAEVLVGSGNFRPECVGITPRFGVWAHICGTDLVRDRDGIMYVLEDNLRVPSGVSYMLGNRQVMKRIFPEVFRTTNILAASDYIAGVSSAVQKQHADRDAASTNFEATFIFGGQIGTDRPETMLIYPQGNYIHESEEHPFLQTGEVKYGKPILDRVIKRSTPLAHAARCALVSMNSTVRSNLTVGPPIDLLIYEKGRLDLGQRITLTENDPFALQLSEAWNQGLLQALDDLPRFPWEH